MNLKTVLVLKVSANPVTVVRYYVTIYISVPFGKKHLSDVSRKESLIQGSCVELGTRGKCMTPAIRLK